MNPRTHVSSNDQSLREDIIPEITKAEIQIPDFQREWEWNDDRIRELLSSVSLAYPIGAVMLLSVGETTEFQTRTITGAPTQSPKKQPKSLVLDGQQRLTALYQVLAGTGPVVVGTGRSNQANRYYYIHMPAALGELGDEADVIVSCGEDMDVRLTTSDTVIDLTEENADFKNHLFPVRMLLDPGLWGVDYISYWKQSDESRDRYTAFHDSIIDTFRSYRIPVIALGPDTPLEAVCQVFERVNTAGVTLSVFDLMTAKFASAGFRLRTDWAQREQRLRDSKLDLLADWPSNNTLRDDFLQSVTLLATFQRWISAKRERVSPLPTVGCRRKQILTITRHEYENLGDRAEAGWLRAAQFLHEENIFAHRDLPYRSQLIPLAAILAELGNEADSAPARDLIRQWFWCGVLGELYGSQPHSRFASDIQQIIAMIRERDGKSTTIEESEFSTNRLAKLRTRNSAAYKGVNVLVMQHGAMDFFSKQKIEDVSFFADEIDIHHIFPQKWCNNHGIDPDLRDCILNRTPLRGNTNKRIAARSPSEYIADPEMAPHAEEVLESHATAIESLESDDFDGFLLDRAERLLTLIDAAMGKSLHRDPLEFLSP